MGLSGRWTRLCLVLPLLLACLASDAYAQQGDATLSTVVATTEDGYARLQFKFPKPIKVERDIANGVLVLSLKDVIDIDLENVATAIPSYVVAARSDGTGQTLRFALAQRLTVSILPAAERLFVDLLPEGWSKPLPTLPENVMAELERRAEEEEKAKRRAREGVSLLSGVPLTLHIGRYPTFSRVVFEWNDAVETRLSRSGNAVKIRFNRPGEIDLTRLNVDPPPNVRGAKMYTEDGRTEVEIEVAAGADVRGFRENTSYVLDVSTDDGMGLDEVELPGQAAIESSLPDVPTAEEEILLAGETNDQITSQPQATANQQATSSATTNLPAQEPQQEPVAAQPQTQTPEPEAAATVTAEATPSVEPEAANGAASGPATGAAPEIAGNAEDASGIEISVKPLVIGEGAPAAETTAPPAQAETANNAAAEAPVATPNTEMAAAPASAPEAEAQVNEVRAAEPVAESVPSEPVADMATAQEATTELAAANITQDLTPVAELPSSQSVEADEAELTPSIFAEDSASSALPGLLKRNTKTDAKVVTKMVGQTLRLTVPFGQPVAGAVFQRAQTLWMVFDADAPLDVSEITKNGEDRIQDVSHIVSGRMQILRLKLKRRFLATASPRPREWVVSIGDLVIDPTTPVSLERALRTDGRTKVVVNLPDNGQVHWISDTEVGDQLAVVTAFGPARGLIKRQEFVEFAALPTAHGLAFQPIADDLAVRIAFSEVVVTRDAGLTVSAGRTQTYVPGAKATADGTRPGFVDFESWQQGDERNYRFHTQRLTRAIAHMDETERVGARLELARLYLAHGLGAEANGELNLAVEDDPEIENEPMFRAMRGIAKIFANHLEDASTDFAVHGLSQDPHSALWRGVIAARTGQWRAAQRAFDEGEVALDAYPAEHQAHFRVAAAQAALMVNDLESASQNLDALPLFDLDPADQRKTKLLRGQLNRALGKSNEALALFTELENGRWGSIAAEAKFNRLSLEVQAGTIPDAEAIEALETMAISWRGDDVELSVMQTLAELLVKTGNFQRALSVMREAVISHNGEERTRQIHEEMTQIFEQIFLEDSLEEMKPLTALSLYYDFRELTPVGRRGDEMIRKLVRRLIEVDLLSQAADLLNHQVEKRLTGSARAQVASDLSLIYLMDHKPERALRAIRRTRQAILPVSLQQKRNILEARALAELGRVEIAVELLNSMEGADIEELKADALWRGKRWQDAGMQFEKMLGDSWQADEEFGDNHRFNVMRAGISFALANDRIGLERLRRKYISKMSASPDSVKFDVVTKVGDQNVVAFNNLAAEIAEIETLSTFVKNFQERYGETSSNPLQEAPDTPGGNTTSSAGSDGGNAQNG